MTQSFKEPSVDKTSGWGHLVSYFRRRIQESRRAADQTLRFKSLKKGKHFPATVDRGENGFGDFLADDQVF